jgi:hypothetical protein
MASKIVPGAFLPRSLVRCLKPSDKQKSFDFFDQIFYKNRVKIALRFQTQRDDPGRGWSEAG